MSDWDEFTGQLLDALRRFAQGDAEPYKSLWSRGRCDDLRRLGRLPLGTGRTGLSSGLIRRGSRASAEDRTRPELQVTDHADLPRTHVHKLGKRVGRQPSRVRISHPPAMLSRDDRAGLRQHSGLART